MKCIEQLLLLGAIAVKSNDQGNLDISLGGIAGKSREALIHFAKTNKESILYELSDPSINEAPNQVELKNLFEYHSMKCSACPHLHAISQWLGLCRLTGYETSVLACCSQICCCHSLSFISLS